LLPDPWIEERRGRGEGGRGRREEEDRKEREGKIRRKRRNHWLTYVVTIHIWTSKLERAHVITNLPGH